MNNIMAGQQLGGVGTVVEIDESKFYTAKYHRGRDPGIHDGWVFGLIERGTNKVIMVSVAKGTVSTLLPIIQQHVLPGTRIISDGWAAYGGIAALQQGYLHNRIIHDLHFVDPNDPTIHTQSIEATWGAVKRSMKHLSGTTDALFETYFYNYMFRRFYNREKIFWHLWQQVAQMYPVDP